MIAFTSFISPALDWDLMDHWVRHYRAFNFDRYHIFVHAGREDTGYKTENTTAHIVNLLDDNDFDVDVVYGDFDNGGLQKKHLQAFKDTLGPDDTLVVADSDEFHDIEPLKYRDLINKYEVIRGNLVDRWGSTLNRAQPDVPLQEQYPNSGCIAEAVASKFKMRYKWPPFRQYAKVLAHRVKHRVVLDGAHFAVDLPFTVKPLEFQKVFHYTWRNGVIERFAQRSHMDPWWTLGIARMFNVDEDDLLPIYSRIAREYQVCI